jgi:hypothetical protein
MHRAVDAQGELLRDVVESDFTHAGMPSLRDARQRLPANVGIDQAADVAFHGKLAEGHHLLLDPDQVLDRNGEIRVDGYCWVS